MYLLIYTKHLSKVRLDSNQAKSILFDTTKILKQILSMFNLCSFEKYHGMLVF